jgi:hypothetical protein
MLAKELERLRAETGEGSRLDEAAQLLERLVAAKEVPEFLTLEAYGRLG